MTAKSIILFDNIIGGKGDIFDIKNDLFDREFNRYIFLLSFVGLNVLSNSYFRRLITKRIKRKRRGFIDLRLPLFFKRIRYRKTTI